MLCVRSFSAEQRVRNAFKVLDLDKSGLLSSAEVVDGLGSIGYHVSARDVEQWFATTDADESGEIPSSSCLVSSRLVSSRFGWDRRGVVTHDSGSVGVPTRKTANE